MNTLLWPNVLRTVLDFPMYFLPNARVRSTSKESFCRERTRSIMLACSCTQMHSALDCTCQSDVARLACLFVRVLMLPHPHRWPLTFSLLNTAASTAVLAMLSIDGRCALASSLSRHCVSVHRRVHARNNNTCLMRGPTRTCYSF